MYDLLGKGRNNSFDMMVWCYDLFSIEVDKGRQFFWENSSMMDELICLYPLQETYYVVSEHGNNLLGVGIIEFSSWIRNSNNWNRKSGSSLDS